MTITIPPGLPPTQPQRDYLDGLRKRLHLTEYVLSNHCVTRFGKKLGALDRAETSALIDEMKGWEGIPAEVMKAAGQAELPGFGT